MALQSSGAISLSNIAGEFGGSTPHSINEYYRGGSNVPNTSTNNSIPTSGQIQFDDFYGSANQSADNVVSYAVQNYTTGSGKNVFSNRGANNNMSDGSLVTNNLNSYTVLNIGGVYPNTQGIFGYSIEFTGTGNGYNAYTTGLVRGVTWSGNGYSGGASFIAPSSGNASLSLQSFTGDSIDTAHQTLGGTMTWTFTY